MMPPYENSSPIPGSMKFIEIVMSGSGANTKAGVM